MDTSKHRFGLRGIRRRAVERNYGGAKVVIYPPNHPKETKVKRGGWVGSMALFSVLKICVQVGETVVRVGA
jgi:hypothetical protein